MALPSLEAQAEIVDMVSQAHDKIDRVIVQLDRELLLSTEWREALITAAVTGQLDIAA
ncbi:MAG: hypothetical protein ACR2JU_13985 [Nocardioidaceae bacterium]